MLIKINDEAVKGFLSSPLGDRIREDFARKRRKTVNSLKTLPDILFVLRKVHKYAPSEMAQILRISTETYKKLESGEKPVSLRVYKYLIRNFELPEELEKFIFSLVVFRNSNLDSYIKQKKAGKIFVFPQLYENKKQFNAFLLFYRKLLVMSDFQIDAITEYLEGVKNESA